MIEFDMADFNRFERDLRRMEKFPTRYLTAAVKSNSKMILQEVKRNIDSTSKGHGDGTMKRALILKTEKSKKRGKRVVQTVFDSAFNHILAGESGGGRYYYPASQEYGWTLKSGRKMPGRKFMRKAADSKETQFKMAVIHDMMKRIEKAWRGR